MNRNLRIWCLIGAATLLLFSAACGDSEGTPPGDEADAGQDAADDAQPDGEADAGDDVEDVAADEGGDDVAEDTAQDPFEDVEEPTVSDGFSGDHGTDCSDDAAVCEEPWVCSQGVCTLDLAGRTYVEQSYQITEPEELVHVFDFVKTFAADVAFLLMDISEEGDATRRPTRYGSADRVVRSDTREVVYAWQFPEIDRFLLTPVRGESGLNGHAFESNVFQWNLKAHVVLDELRVDTTFGFIAELTQVYVEFSESLQVGNGEFRGIITRREAEDRVIGDTEFEPFRAVICQVHPGLVPLGEDWELADVLDCNATPMDVDLNGDGILDGYNTVVEMRVEPAEIIDPDDIE